MPLEEILSKPYASEKAARIRKGEKAHVARLQEAPPTYPEKKDTTHVCVVDGEGNVVSMTHSLGEAPRGR